MTPTSNKRFIFAVYLKTRYHDSHLGPRCDLIWPINSAVARILLRGPFLNISSHRISASGKKKCITTAHRSCHYYTEQFLWLPSLRHVFPHQRLLYHFLASLAREHVELAQIHLDHSRGDAGHTTLRDDEGFLSFYCDAFISMFTVRTSEGF